MSPSLNRGQEEARSAAELATALSTLADEQRLRIIELLADGDRTSREISQALALAPRAVVGHLVALEKAGLVQRLGLSSRNSRRYSLNRDRAVAINSLYFALLGRATGQPLRAEVAGWEEGPRFPVDLLPTYHAPPPDACQQCRYSSYIFDLLDDLSRMLGESRGNQTRLRQLSTQVLTAHEEERKRIARELHDDTAQALTSLLVRLRLLERSAEAREQRDGFQELRQLTGSALEGVRRLALDLRPSALDDLGLVAALQAYTQAFAQRWPIRIHFTAVDLKRRLPADIELVLYRVVQEALTNVAKHARASSARVTLERRGGSVTVSVEDDGEGFDVASTLGSRDKGLGLFGMQERLALVGGRLHIESTPGGGTRVVGEVPLPRRAGRHRSRKAL